jgi:dTDP-4-amino-4,6-dideoxygalactose transaminase
MPYYKNIGYLDAGLVHAEKYYSRCISLPMYPTLTDEEQKYVIENVLSSIYE